MVKAVKKFFNIETAYKFEWNDLRTLLTIVNVFLIIAFGVAGSWFGLAISIFGIVKEMTGNRHINCLVSYVATIVLNVYFITLLG